MRLALLLVGSGLFFFAGFTAAMTLTYDRNVAGGECGYDGSCTDAGIVDSLGLVYLLCMAAAALLVGAIVWAHRRTWRGWPSGWRGVVARHWFVAVALCSAGTSVAAAMLFGFVAHRFVDGTASGARAAVAGYEQATAILMTAVVALLGIVCRPSTQLRPEQGSST